MTDQQQSIDAGREYLDPVLLPSGFLFKVGSGGSGSGGPFATGVYEREHRLLTFSFRWHLGCVEYRVKDFKISHNELVKRLGVERESEYRWYSQEDPMNGFRTLATDIERYLAPFLSGTDAEFIAYASGR